MGGFLFKNMSNSAQNLQLCPPYIVFEDCKVPELNSKSIWRYKFSKLAFAQVDFHFFQYLHVSIFNTKYLLNHAEQRGECQKPKNFQTLLFATKSFLIMSVIGVEVQEINLRDGRS